MIYKYLIYKLINITLIYNIFLQKMEILWEIRMLTLKTKKYYIIPYIICYIITILYFFIKYITSSNRNTKNISDFQNYRYILFNYINFDEFNNNVTLLINANRNEFTNNIEQIFENQSYIEKVLVYENEESFKNNISEDDDNYIIEFKIDKKNEINVYFIFNELIVDNLEKISNQLNIFNNFNILDES